MTAIRFDIMKIGANWWLTDSGALGAAFHTAQAALAEARRRAELHPGPASVHLWENGVPRQVHPVSGADGDRQPG